MVYDTLPKDVNLLHRMFRLEPHSLRQVALEQNFINVQRMCENPHMCDLLALDEPLGLASAIGDEWITAVWGWRSVAHLACTPRCRATIELP